MDGFIPCAPEAMRRYTEDYLHSQTSWTGRLSLEAYSLARNIASEHGNGTPETKVALALSTLGQARLRSTSAHKLITQNNIQPGTYGQINFASVETEQQVRRWTASSKNPSLQDLAVALFVLNGHAGAPGDPTNFARGADDQAHVSIFRPKGGNRDGFLRHADNQKYWVGNIPGIDPHDMVLMRRMPFGKNSTAGKALIKRGQDMMNSNPPKWAGLAVCPRPEAAIQVASGAALGAAAFAALVGVLKSAPIVVAL